MILQSSENSKRNRERDVNTLGGNTLGLLREARNFVLFRIYDYVVQRSLNENIIFYIASAKAITLKGENNEDFLQHCVAHMARWKTMARSYRFIKLSTL